MDIPDLSCPCVVNPLFKHAFEHTNHLGPTDEFRASVLASRCGIKYVDCGTTYDMRSICSCRSCNSMVALSFAFTFICAEVVGTWGCVGRGEREDVPRYDTGSRSRAGHPPGLDFKFKHSLPTAQHTYYSAAACLYRKGSQKELFMTYNVRVYRSLTERRLRTATIHNETYSWASPCLCRSFT